MLYSLSRRLSHVLSVQWVWEAECGALGAAGQEFHAVFTFRNKTENFGPSKTFMRFRVGAEARTLAPSLCWGGREFGYGGTRAITNSLKQGRAPAAPVRPYRCETAPQRRAGSTSSLRPPPRTPPLRRAAGPSAAGCGFPGMRFSQHRGPPGTA